MNYKDYVKGFIGKMGIGIESSGVYLINYSNIKLGQGCECSITEVHDDFSIIKCILPDIGSFYHAITISILRLVNGEQDNVLPDR
jgi:hypothetical protein